MKSVFPTRIKLLFALMVIVCYSCQTEYIEDIQIFHKPLYVINSVLCPSLPIQFNIDQTKSKFGNTEKLPEIIEASLLIDNNEFPLVKNDSCSFILKSINLQQGQVCKVKFVNACNETIEATTTIPSANTNLTISLTPSSKGNNIHKLQISNSGGKYFKLSACSYKWLDNKLRRKDQYFDVLNNLTNVKYFVQNDGILRIPEIGFADADIVPNTVNTIYFTSEFFEENQVEYIIDFEKYGNPDSVEFFLDVLNKDYWKYVQTLQKEQNNKYNEFATPVQVFSNIENGVGILAAKLRFSKMIEASAVE